MGHISIILVAFAILENSGNFASACSLLPGGKPKCFPDAVDYEAQNPQLREIKYRLDKKHIFGYDCNIQPECQGDETGACPRYIIMDVRLGQHWEKKIGTKKDIVRCTQDTRKEAYLSEYAPQLYDYTRQGEGKVKGKTKVTELFLITKKEVWDCKNQASTSPINFKRIVTELVGRVEFGSIFFFDGIEVTTIPLPWDRNDKRARVLLNNTIAREVKYIDHQDNNRVIRYDGQLEFDSLNYFKDEDSSVFKPVSVSAKIYEKAKPNQMKNYFELGNHIGLNLEDIHRPSGHIGKYDSEATCKILEEDSRLYSIKYLPHWAERTITEKNGYRLEQMYTLGFEARFIVTKHEIWSCTMKQGGENFERQVMEYIGLSPIKTMDYYVSGYYCSTGNKVWVYDMDMADSENDRKSVGIRSEFFFTETEAYQRRIYEGSLNLEEPVEEEIPKKKGFWTRLFRNLFSSEDDMPEDQYKLRFDENDDKWILHRPR